MKVKMTRTERAIRKAQKAAKVAYKLAKAPTLYEFTNPVDLMTKEEKFQWELEKYFEDIKGTQYYDEVMSTCEWLLNDEETWVSESTTGRELAQWVFNEYYLCVACKKVADIPEFKDRIKYTREVVQMMGLDSLAESARTFLEEASRQLGHLLTEVEVDTHVQVFALFVAQGVVDAYGYYDFPAVWKESTLLNNAKGVWMLEQILGRAVTECSKYTIQHAEFDFQDYPANRPVPAKFAVGVARSQEALAWLSQLKGEVDWSKGNTYKKAIMASIERVLGLKDTNGTLWGCPSALKVPAFFESIGHKEATPYAYETHTVEDAQGWTIKPVAKGSIDNLIIGDLTGCCQKLGGWGEYVCIDGWDDEHNINYGIYSPNGNLRAHFWTYMDKSGRLVVDSIEGAVLLEDDTKFIGFELISRWIGSSKYPVLVSETCYGITDAFCDWMVNFTGTMTSVKNHEPKGFYRYLDNKHEKAFFFPSYSCQIVPVAHDEKWCYDHDEYLKKARAVRGPVDEPCDPYEWDDEYDDL